jgi:hypothetical protein
VRHSEEFFPELNQEFDSPMKCDKCAELLSDYKHAVTLFTTALLDGGNPQTAKETEDLARKCNDTSAALMEHLREHRRDLSQTSASL